MTVHILGAKIQKPAYHMENLEKLAMFLTFMMKFALQTIKAGSEGEQTWRLQRGKEEKDQKASQDQAQCFCGVEEEGGGAESPVNPARSGSPPPCKENYHYC